MFDLAQHLVTSDLSLHLSAIDISSNLHLNIADLHSHINMDLLAQQYKPTDITGDVGKGWSNFVKTGQIWALIIGVAVGYLFRSITNS
jgi:hypothetical protein